MAWNLLGQRAVALWPQLGSDFIGLEMLLLWMLIVVGFESSGALEVRGLLCKISCLVLVVAESRSAHFLV
jgi:hypothetical protein